MAEKDRSHYLSGDRIDPIPLKKDLTIKELIDNFNRSSAFNAGRLGEACNLYHKMLSEDVTVALTISGAMSPTGLGGALISLIERGFVDVIISTGANLYHDLHFALDLPVHQGDFRADDRELFKEKIVRIYDVFVPETALDLTDAFLRELFQSNHYEKPISTAELHYSIGKATLDKAKYPEKSFVAQAAKYDVPIYSPSPGDSSIGINLAALKLDGAGLTIDPDLDVLETSAIVLGSKKNGVIELGGGSPKNFYLQTQPVLQQILSIDVTHGHDYVIQITIDPPQYGGLSGATPSEAISWGKVDPDHQANNVVVYADTTIAAPILFNYVVTTTESKKPKRIFAKRKELMDDLRAKYLEIKAQKAPASPQ